MATFTWIGADPFPSLWTDPANWQVGGLATLAFPNSATDVAIVNADGVDGFEFPFITGGAVITLASLSAAGTAHVIVGTGQLGGVTGGGTLNAGSISVTSTNPGGGLVGEPGGTITTASMTVGAGTIIGGGGIFNVANLVNSGTIQADGGNFNLGALTVRGGAITGTGSIEVDGASTFDLGSATAETITVVVAPTQTASIIFENPGSFTGALNLFSPQSHVNLFFKGQTPTGATFDSNTNSLIITGATGQLDKIPFGSNGISVFATPASTLPGFGEISIGPGTGPSVPPPAPDRDFNADGRSDILWQNDDGTVVTWLMDAAGTGLVGGAVVGPNPGPTWHVKGSGDFNGDGRADILWQNDDGTVVTWLVDATGTGLIGGAVVGPNPGPTWHVKGSGDFNGDGHGDILWQNDDGTAVTWLMDATGTGLIGGAVVGPNPGPTWHVKGSGDFNGDGHADILWQNDDGTVVTWLVDASGTGLIGGAVVGPNPGPTWHVKGSGDFNGDGHSDILWQNDDGTVVTWLVDASGTGLIGGAVVGPNPGPTWHVKGAEDVNGDGHADILWQNDDGTVVTWLVDASGTGLIGGAVVGPNPGPTWQVKGSDDLHFITATPDTGTLTATSQADEFVLTSHATGLETISGFDPRQDILELSKAKFAGLADVQAHLVASGGGALLALDSSSSLLLSGMAPGQLNATNIVFA